MDRNINVNSFSLRSRCGFCSCDEGPELHELLQASSSCPEVPGQCHHERLSQSLESVREILLVSKAVQSRFSPALGKTALSTTGDLKDSRIFVLPASFLAIPPKRQHITPSCCRTLSSEIEFKTGRDDQNATLCSLEKQKEKLSIFFPHALATVSGNITSLEVSACFQVVQNNEF